MGTKDKQHENTHETFFSLDMSERLRAIINRLAVRKKKSLDWMIRELIWVGLNTAYKSDLDYQEFKEQESCQEELKADLEFRRWQRIRWK